MALSNTAVTESMQRITETKLDALNKRHATHESLKGAIISEVDKEPSAAERVRILLNRLEENDLKIPSGLHTSVIRAFLEQSRHDPSVSPTLLDTWERDLKTSLEIPSRKYEHAKLFGRLAMEWLKGEEGQEALDKDGCDSFEAVGRKEMHEQRTEWEKLVFTPRPEPDADKLKQYLTSLFERTTESQMALRTLKETMERFKLEHFDADDVQTTITHLVKSDLLSHQKQAALKDLLSNELVHSEIADVLNMQIDTLNSWSWGAEPIPLDVRRGLNGKYRVFMDEDLLTAILLQYIGLHWCVYAKQSLQNFMNTVAWEQSASNLNRPRSAGRDRQPRPKPNPASVNTKRWNTYSNEYFMQHLPSDFSTGPLEYGDNLAPKDVDAEFKSFASRKQDLFHLITTECLVSSRLHGSWTVLQSDFRWFGPSLSHTTVLEVLRFLGIKETWLQFFRKYLQPSLRFAMDGPSGDTFTRKSGVPISHSLTDFMGEAVLFCLDFAVNAESKGNLYRVHDDIWFWGTADASISVWNTLQKFCAVTGLELNKDKTGYAQVFHGTKVKQPSLPNTLPRTAVKWGFLIFDPTAGRWKINAEEVSKHVSELRLQLAATKSIFAWTQAWNTYVTHFLANNFGTPANCLGKQHVDMVIRTITRIQNELFSTSSKPGSSDDAPNVTAYLKSELASRFNVSKQIPDGVIYFPLELGGLGLRNPLVPLLLLREKAPDKPDWYVTDALDFDETRYNTLVRENDKGEDSPAIREIRFKDGSLLSWPEVRGYAESSSARLGERYEELMQRPNNMEVDLGKDVSAVLDDIDSDDEWDYDPYWRWVFQLYGGEVIKEFGGLAMGERRLLPLGLVRMMRSARVRWQG